MSLAWVKDTDELKIFAFPEPGGPRCHVMSADPGFSVLSTEMPDAEAEVELDEYLCDAAGLVSSDAGMLAFHIQDEIAEDKMGFVSQGTEILSLQSRKCTAMWDCLEARAPNCHAAVMIAAALDDEEDRVVNSVYVCSVPEGIELLGLGWYYDSVVLTFKWAPDGNSIAVMHSHLEIVSLSLHMHEGGHSMNICDENNIELDVWGEGSLRWSPKGNQLACVCAPARLCILTLKAETGKATQAVGLYADLQSGPESDKSYLSAWSHSGALVIAVHWSHATSGNLTQLAQPDAMAWVIDAQTVQILQGFRFDTSSAGSAVSTLPSELVWHPDGCGFNLAFFRGAAKLHVSFDVAS